LTWKSSRPRNSIGVVLLAAPHFADQKNRIEHDSRDDHGHQQNAENQEQPGAPVQEHPAHIEQERDGNQADAERYE